MDHMRWDQTEVIRLHMWSGPCLWFSQIQFTLIVLINVTTYYVDVCILWSIYDRGSTKNWYSNLSWNTNYDDVKMIYVSASRTNYIDGSPNSSLRASQQGLHWAPRRSVNGKKRNQLQFYYLGIRLKINRHKKIENWEFAFNFIFEIPFRTKKNSPIYWNRLQIYMENPL